MCKFIQNLNIMQQIAIDFQGPLRYFGRDHPDCVPLVLAKHTNSRLFAESPSISALQIPPTFSPLHLQSIFHFSHAASPSNDETFSEDALPPQASLSSKNLPRPSSSTSSLHLLSIKCDLAAFQCQTAGMDRTFWRQVKPEI